MAGIYGFSYVDTNLGPMIQRGGGINRIFKKSDKLLSGITKSLHSLGKIKNELSGLTGYGGCICKNKKKGSGLKSKMKKK